MSRRRKLLLVALVLGATTLYALWRAPQWGAHLIESRLSAQLQASGECREPSAFVSRPPSWSCAACASQARRPTRRPSSRSTRCACARASPPGAATVSCSRASASRGCGCAFTPFPSPPLGPGGDDIPKLGGGGGGGLSVAIERLVIVGGEFVLDHERVPLDLDLPDFHGRLLGRPEGGIAGHLSFEPGRLRWGAPRSCSSAPRSTWS